MQNTLHYTKYQRCGGGTYSVLTRVSLGLSRLFFVGDTTVPPWDSEAVERLPKHRTVSVSSLIPVKPIFYVYPSTLASISIIAVDIMLNSHRSLLLQKAKMLLLPSSLSFSDLVFYFDFRAFSAIIINFDPIQTLNRFVLSLCS